MWSWCSCADRKFPTSDCRGTSGTRSLPMMMMMMMMMLMEFGIWRWDGPTCRQLAPLSRSTAESGWHSLPLQTHVTLGTDDKKGCRSGFLKGQMLYAGRCWVIRKAVTWLNWLKPLSPPSIGHQRTVSTSRDPVLLHNMRWRKPASHGVHYIIVNPMWRRLPSSRARLLFSRCSLVCLYSFVLEGSTSELFLRCCLLVSSTYVLYIHVHLLPLSRTSADSWSVAFHITHFIVPSYSKNPSEWQET